MQSVARVRSSSVHAFQCPVKIVICRKTEEKHLTPIKQWYMAGMIRMATEGVALTVEDHAKFPLPAQGV